MADPCAHLNFAAFADVARLSDVEDGPITAFLVELSVKCADCDMPFCFRGMPLGMSHMEPRMSLDARTASLPIHPEDGPNCRDRLAGIRCEGPRRWLGVMT